MSCSGGRRRQRPCAGRAKWALGAGRGLVHRWRKGWSPGQGASPWSQYQGGIGVTCLTGHIARHLCTGAVPRGQTCTNRLACADVFLSNWERGVHAGRSFAVGEGEGWPVKIVPWNTMEKKIGKRGGMLKLPVAGPYSTLWHFRGGEEAAVDPPYEPQKTKFAAVKCSKSGNSSVGVGAGALGMGQSNH